MSFYEDKILPHLINCACGLGQISKQRSLTVPHAYGDVLDIGFGSGLNLPFYDFERVTHLHALEPSKAMWQKAQDIIGEFNPPISWLDAPAEHIPLSENSIDTVVLTFTLCTIPDIRTALDEIKRVLKPQGVLLVCEHGLSSVDSTQKWQNRLNPMWKRIAGGCNLNRAIASAVEDAGFEFDELTKEQIPGLKIASFIYRGVARVKSY